jgi:hypothetical protein
MKIGGGFGLLPAAVDCGASDDSSVESAEKRLLVVMGRSQWMSSFECFASRVESSCGERPLLLVTFFQGMEDSWQ